MGDSTTHPIFSMLLTHTTSGPPVDGVARALLWDLCKQYGFERSDKRYEHIPKNVEDNENFKFLWYPKTIGRCVLSL